MALPRQVYIRDLKNMRAELIALKTAHTRPLGTFDFFKSSETFSISLEDVYGYYYRTFYITVVIETPSVTPPILQTGWSIPSGFFETSILDSSVSSDYSTWTYELELGSESATSASVTVSVLSSQPIVSIARTYSS